MEIVKIGEKINIDGYEGIILSDSMLENISEFARVNGLSENQASQILSQIPALTNFIDGMDFTDDEAIIDFSADFIDETKTKSSNEKSEIETTTTSTTIQNSISNSAFQINDINTMKKLNEEEFGDYETPVTEIKYAQSSSNLTNEQKNILGLFGLEEDTQVDRYIYNENNKITGIIAAGVTYEIIFAENGSISQLKVTRNESTKIKNYGENPRLTEIRELLEINNQKIDKIATSLISILYDNFKDIHKKILKDALDAAFNEDNKRISIGDLAFRIATILGDKGLDVTQLKKDISQKTPIGRRFIDLCQQTSDYYHEKKNLEDYIAAHTEYVNLEGMNFRVTWDGDEKPDFSFEILEDNTISINAINCVIDLFDLGKTSKNIKLQGQNITLNSNNLTVGKITNYAKDVILNGSFGNDQILNKESATNAQINGLKGDDVILNTADNAKLNGNEGNDTIVNIGKNAIITGGDGNDVINTIADSTVNDIENNDILNIIETDEYFDINYKYCQTFSRSGVLFTVYSNSPININSSYYQNLLTLETSNSKITVHSSSNPNISLQLEGDNIEYQSSIKFNTLFNYAENSTLSTSDSNDLIFNYAKGVKILGNDGDDKIINEATDVIIDGGAGSDSINDRNSTGQIIYDSKDEIINGGNNSSTNQPSKILINISGSKNSVEYNRDLIKRNIEMLLNNITFEYANEPNEDTLSQVDALMNKLFDEANTTGKRELNDFSKNLITNAKNANLINNNLDDLEALEQILLNADISNEGLVSIEEIDKYSQNAQSTLEELYIQAELDTFWSSAAIGKLDLSTTEKNEIINNAGSKSEALKLLRQVEVILNTSTINSYSIKEIKNILLNSTFSFNNEILADAQIIVEANETNNPQAYIKSKMIVDATNMTIEQMLANTKVGDVAEKDSILYVNDGTNMVKLDLTSETYMELFPLVERYLVEQNNVNDCFFIANALVDYMENPYARVKILQIFSEDNNGNITLTFPGVDEYPVTFENGNLKDSDNKFTQNNQIYAYTKNGVEQLTSDVNIEEQYEVIGSKGLIMLEQAYALAKFTALSNSNITADKINELGTILYNAATDEKVNDASTLDIDKAYTFYKEGGYDFEVLNDLTSQNMISQRNSFSDSTVVAKQQLAQEIAAMLIARDKYTVSISILNAEISETDKNTYDLIAGHQYSLEKIDTMNEIVYIKNPWAAYKIIALPYEKFIQYFSAYTTCEFV